MSATPRCPIHNMPDCSPLLNGCDWPGRVAKVAAYEDVLAEVRARCVTQRDAIRATYDPSVTPYHYYANACDDILAILDREVGR